VTTDKLDLYEVDLSVSGWDAIFNADIQKIDDGISTIEIREYGETIAAYEAVYVKSDGKYWLAEADGTKQPAFGIAIDAGIATDEKRVRTRGLMTNGSWTWSGIGGYIYLNPSTPGALTETQPADNAQIMGIILSATEIFVSIAVASTRPLQIGGTFNGSPTSSLYLTRLPISQSATFPADLADSMMYAGTTATASTVFSIRKIESDQTDTEFGTATFLPDTLIDNAAAVDKGGGKVGIPITGHGFSTGQKIILSGTTNYDGTHLVDTDSTTNEVVIVDTYNAETFAGTEDVLMNWAFFVSASGAAFTDGDLLIIRSPASPDATLADFGWNIVGSRQA
jgi:hypothetical protein